MTHERRFGKAGRWLERFPEEVSNFTGIDVESLSERELGTLHRCLSRARGACRSGQKRDRYALG